MMSVSPVMAAFLCRQPVETLTDLTCVIVEVAGTLVSLATSATGQVRTRCQRQECVLLCRCLIFE